MTNEHITYQCNVSNVNMSYLMYISREAKESQESLTVQSPTRQLARPARNLQSKSDHLMTTLSDVNYYFIQNQSSAGLWLKLLLMIEYVFLMRWSYVWPPTIIQLVFCTRSQLNLSVLYLNINSSIYGILLIINAYSGLIGISQFNHHTL